MASEKEQEQQQGEQQQGSEQQEQEQEQQQQQQASEQASNQAQEDDSSSSPQKQNQPPASTQEQAPTPQQQAPQQPSNSQRNNRPAVHKTDYEQDVVYLYHFPRTSIGPMPSPFSLKVETWLRITATKYENVDHRMKFRSKKGQLPFVELNGAEIADSAIIVRELSKYFGKDLDAALTPDQRSLSHALSIMLDHHTGWVYRWWAYNHPGDYIKATKMNSQHFLNSKIPNAILNLIVKMRMKANKKKVQAQGMGVHSPDEIFEFGKEDFVVLRELLGDKPFFFGDEPTVLDCVAFSHLIPVMTMGTSKIPLKEFLETECSRLVSLAERIKERYWPDWEEMGKTLDINTHLPKKKKPEEDDDEKENKEKNNGGEKENKEKNGGEKEKSSGNGTPDDKESEPEKEKVEKDEKEKEKEKEVDEGDNKQKEGLEEKIEENKKE